MAIQSWPFLLPLKNKNQGIWKDEYFSHGLWRHRSKISKTGCIFRVDRVMKIIYKPTWIKCKVIFLDIFQSKKGRWVQKKWVPLSTNQQNFRNDVIRFGDFACSHTMVKYLGVGSPILPPNYHNYHNSSFMKVPFYGLITLNYP